MKRKTEQRTLSFKVSDDLFAYFDKQDNKTAFLRNLVELHKELQHLIRCGAEEVKKKFTGEEFLLLCEIFNDYVFTDRTKNVFLQIEIGDADRLYFESHGVTRDELNTKVRALGVADTYFLTFAIEKFWEKDGFEDDDENEITVKCGKVSDSFKKLEKLCTLEADKLLKDGKINRDTKIAFWTSDAPELIGTGVFSDDGKFNLDTSESTL